MVQPVEGLKKGERATSVPGGPLALSEAQVVHWQLCTASCGATAAELDL